MGLVGRSCCLGIEAAGVWVIAVGMEGEERQGEGFLLWIGRVYLVLFGGKMFGEYEGIDMYWVSPEENTV